MDVVKHLLVVVCIASAVFFSNLGQAKLWDEDEPRNAGCAVEMLARGDWIVPYFNGEVRTHKPVLLYWFMMSAYSAFGVNEFAARFWSALLAVGTVAIATLIGRRLLGPRTGLVSGVALSTMLMFVVAARAATPDSVLIFFIAASLGVYVWTTPLFGLPIRLSFRYPFVSRQAPASEQARAAFPIDLPAVLLMYGLMGMACLDKGPVGFLVPTAIIGMFLLIQRLPESQPVESQDWLHRTLGALKVFHPVHFLKTCTSMRLGWLIVAVLAVALPWYTWVTIRSDGVWTRGFFLDHNVGRAVNAMENHGGSPLYYLIAFLVGTFPCSIFFLPALIDLSKTLRENDEPDSQRAGLIFLSCWVLVIVGLFSLASTKLPSYITPCYPAAAILAANFLVRLAENKVRSATYWPYVSFSVLALVGIAIAVAIPTVATEFVPNAGPLLWVGIALVIGAAAATYTWHSGATAWTVRTTLATGTVFVFLMFAWGAPRVSEMQQIDRIADAIRQSGDEPVVACSGVQRSSWVFYVGRPIHPIRVDGMEVTEFLAQGQQHFVIATSPAAEKILDGNGGEIEVVESVPFFLEPGQDLVLLHARNDAVAAALSPSDLR